MPRMNGPQRADAADASLAAKPCLASPIQSRNIYIHQNAANFNELES